MAAAQYGQQQEMNRESLDAALASAVALAHRLKTERSWSSQYFRRLTGRASQQERQA
jgi:Arc/MetJ family transcription regulator